LAIKSLKSKKILVTCGPTWVPIDDMRVISNRSTGEFGHVIAENLKKEGAVITLLEGPVTSTERPKGVRVLKFLFFDELSNLLNEELKNDYDIVIHAAAVSDYQPTHTYGSKISSEFSRLTLNLTPAPKLIDNMKKINPKIFLVGFKLESSIEKEHMMVKAQNLMKRADCDLVIANCQDNKSYIAYIVDKERNVLGQGVGKKDVAKTLTRILKEKL